MDVTPRLKLPFMGTDQLQKELTFNELAAMIDTLLHANALDKDLSAPPATPEDGETYIIGAAPTGAWAGKADYLAYYIGGWHYLAPQDGWLVWVADESKYYRYSAGAWVATLVTPIDLLASLTDVNTGTLDASKDGLALTYDNATGKFILSEVASLFANLADVDVTGIADGQTVVWDEGTGKFIAADTAAGSFIGQADTPAAYAGNGGKLVAVNGTEDGLAFVEVDLGGDPITTLLGLEDTPDSFTGQAGKVLVVNPSEDGTFFEDPATLSEGVPAGGLTDQVLRKTSDADFETEWVDPGELGIGLPALTGNAHKLLAVAADESAPEWVPLDTDGTMAANSDTAIPSQKAVKTLVTTLVNALVAAAPGALDTLAELAAALGDDANFASTVTTALAGKVAKTGDTMTGDLIVPDEAYDEAAWDGDLSVPTKNAIRDKIEALVLGGGGGGGSSGSYSAALIARKTTDQTITTGAWRDVTWDVETYDSEGIFTAGGSDFTVPADVHFMEVNVRVNWANSSNSNRFIQLYNVTTASVEAIDIRPAVNEAGQTMNTGIIPVTPGHVYRIQANSGTISTTLSGTGYGGVGVLDVRFLASISDLITGSGIGSSSKWVLVDTNGVETSSPTWTYTGNVATVDVKGLTDYDDLLIVCEQVTADLSGSRAIQVSTDNGASFYSTSGNYVSINANGVRTATTDIARHITFTTAARDFVALIAGAGTSAPLKRALATDREERTFVASPLPINAIRFLNTTGGNLTGGALYVFVRKRTVISSGAAASPAEVWSGSSSDRVMTPNNTFAAAATQDLVDGATITIDGDAGINFRVTLGGNRTLANPTNMKTGQSGVIIVTQDATGGRTLAYGSNWRFPGGAASGGVLSTTANAIDVISYYVRSDGTILANIGKDYKA